MSKTTITIVFIALTTIGMAQNPSSLERKGFVFGASLGIASTFQQFPNKIQSDLDFGFDIKLGYMVKTNLALLLTSNVSAYNYMGIGRHRKRDFGILAPSIQYWINERISIIGGVGFGMDAPIFFDIKEPETNKEEAAYHNGLGMVGSIGYDLYQGKKMAIDLKARVTYRNLKIVEGKTSGVSATLLVGINFY